MDLYAEGKALRERVGELERRVEELEQGRAMHGPLVIVDEEASTPVDEVVERISKAAKQSRGSKKGEQ